MSAVALPNARARRLRIARARLLRRPVAVGALVVVVAIVIAAGLAPWVAPYPPNETNFNLLFAHSSWAHPLGTDQLGRDELSRIIWGARASMQIGFFATLLSMLVAVPLGIAAGYHGGWFDMTVARASDVMLAFPSIILAIGLAAILGPSLRNAMLAIGLAGIPHFIRFARGETLVLREQAYIKSAIVSGAGATTVIFRHILPNMRSMLIVQGAMHIPVAVLSEATLSFLGLGVRPPNPSWGVMLSEGQAYLAQTPRLVLWPGLAIMVAALSFNLLGDGLRDVLDPKTVR
jgi:peptide/nickel transport system permease protein